MTGALGDHLRQVFGESRVQRDVPLAPITTFKVGGRAEWLVHARTGEEIRQALEIARRDVARRPTVESWDALAWVLYRRGEAVEALDASNGALAWGAPSPTIEYHRGRILEALGRRDEAASWLLRATADPRLLDPGARIDLGAR